MGLKNYSEKLRREYTEEEKKERLIVACRLQILIKSKASDFASISPAMMWKELDHLLNDGTTTQEIHDILLDQYLAAINKLFPNKIELKS